MSPKNVVSVLIILACVTAAGVVLFNRQQQQAAVHAADAANDQRLQQSYAFIDTLPLDAKQLETLRAWVPLSHDHAFMLAFQDDAQPPLDEAQYMHLFVADLEGQAMARSDVRLARYLSTLLAQYPSPNADD